MENRELLEVLSYSSTAFLRARDWRDVVEGVLGRLGQAMGVTRVHLFRTIERHGEMVRSQLAYEWAVAPEWSERDSPELKDFTLREFALPEGPRPPAEDQVIVLDVASFPEPERQRWEKRGIVTGLAMALFVGGERWGAIGLDDCFGPRTWTREERSALHTMADLLGAAIERERTERALRESEARLALALASSQQGLWDWDIESGRVVYDRLWSEMLGYDASEIQPHVSQWERLVHPDDLPTAWASLQAHLQGEAPEYVSEHRLLHKDGSWRWILDRGRVVERAADGRAVRAVGTHTDITTARQAERARQHTEEQLRLLQRAVEQSPASIVITDPHGGIVYVNPRFTQVTGYTAEEAIGSNPRILKSGAHSHDYYQDLWSTITAGREWHGELQNRRKDGSLIWEHMIVSPVLDANGAVTHFVAVKEDVTAHRELEEQLRHSQKLEAFGQLAGGVAHDFNNMLTAISGFASLLESEVKPTGDGPAYLAEVQHAASRSADLTRQLLAFSRKQILAPVLLDVNHLVRRFEQMLHRVLGEDVELITYRTPTPLLVRADPGQLEQVLLNLAVNARDAMPHGGTLMITTRELTADDGRAYAEISVRDNGTGIPREYLDRIFEPFFTTKPVGRGTGLGLSTVYGIVMQSDGLIDVDSEPGVGSCFRVRLPIVRGEAGVPLALAAKTVGSGTGTVLVVEDEAAVRALAVAILERAGYRALAASDGSEALDMLERSPGAVHLVLADVVMPGMDGRELSAAMRRRFPEIPLLFMSGHTDDRVLRHGVQQQEVAFLAKPFTSEALLEQVAAAMTRN